MAKKNKGGRPRKTVDRSVRGFDKPPDGIDLRTISRWRKKLNTPEAFEHTYDDALARLIARIEQAATLGVAH